MALETWPAGLSYTVDRGSFRVLEATRPPVVTEFEDGPPLMRRSGLSRRAKLAYRIPWETPQEFDAFRQFHENNLLDGTARFTMPVWIPAIDGYAVRTVMIDKGQYQADPWGLGFAVSFTLIVFDW